MVPLEIIRSYTSTILKMKNDKILVYSFYRFKSLTRIISIKKRLLQKSNKKIIMGTILLANEGINGTISGTKKELDIYVKEIKKILKIRKLSNKVTGNRFIPFYKLKIKLKKEIVTIGDMSIQPELKTGKFIHPRNWDKVLTNKEYIIIDIRNEYEINIGSFVNSLNPKTKSFRDFPKKMQKLNINKNQPVAMFCTGGIRCEKASSYLLNNGYKNVSQLDGGILNYLEFKKNKKTTSWRGECFVFDNRVSINKNLKKGTYDQCYGCRQPITQKDKKLDSYKKGIHCKNCINKRSLKQINSSTTRQQQINRAELNNMSHPFKKIYN